MANAVQAVVTDGYHSLVSRVYSRDVVEVQVEITSYKIGEGGFQVVGPAREPVTPDPTLTDLASEGAVLSGQCNFSFGSATVTGVGTAFLAEVSPGDFIKPAGTDIWGEVLAVPGNTTITLTAVFGGITALLAEGRVAEEPWFTFRKAILAAEVVWIAPNVARITASVLAGEANDDGLGNPPDFFELGLFDANDVMVVYMTMPLETKVPGVVLGHIIDITF